MRPPSSPLPPLSPRKSQPPVRPRVRAYKRADHGSDVTCLRCLTPALQAILRKALLRVMVRILRTIPKCDDDLLAHHQSHKPHNLDKGKGTACECSRASPAASVRCTRCGTLDEVVFRADMFTGAEIDDDTDRGMLVGIRTRSKKHGFLAHGSAGCVPVFMGVGHVEGAEESDDGGR
ncbi:hypothetical protein BD410DRAFT_622447 [Rickenella mellea]|uniref:Uncharacterized protein n=1 Tax=Rickenella mellea TaxID=50990 RepID=A0A4Y7PM35_9AGAM|nr:hypothetical protein BD410DRAFT_622447 [Rickenella mellea]